MALVVLTGTLASLQAAVVSAARVGFAMSRDRVMPEFFRRVRKGGTNPWAATLTMSAINLVLLALSLGTTSVAGGAHQCGQQLRTHFHRLLRNHRGGGPPAAVGNDDVEPKRLDFRAACCPSSASHSVCGCSSNPC